MRSLTVAVTQMACSPSRDRNILRAAEMVEEAACKGAQLVLLQELFETPYFCIDINKLRLAEATTLATNPAVAAMRKLARKHDMVVPVSFYELADGKRYNSLAIVDAGGDVPGLYRKSHIPDFPGFEEAAYFAPGDTGFRVWDTKFGKVGAGVCWDQWFPEAERIMALRGAEVLLYPTAIGRPLEAPGNLPPDSKPHWQLTMQGHAAANQLIVAASNRIGVEAGREHRTDFYGGSFIADERGVKVAELGETDSNIAVHTFDLDRIAAFRKYWGIYRTRRPDLYQPLCQETGPAYLMSRQD